MRYKEETRTGRGGQVAIRKVETGNNMKWEKREERKNRFSLVTGSEINYELQQLNRIQDQERERERRFGSRIEEDCIDRGQLTL